MSAATDFGVQSYCFRSIKDNAEVAKKVREIGLDKIEICSVHADFNDLDGWKETVKTYEDEGVSIISIGVQTINGNVEVERNWFECVKAAGASHMSVHFKVNTFHDAVPAAVKLCEEYDIKLAIHCHGGYMFGGQPDVMAHLLELGGPRIGLCIDTAWCMQIGPRQGKPLQWVERFQDQLYGIHYKDFTFQPDASWTDVVVGTGNLDLPAFVKKLEEVEFDGFAVIEYEGDVDNPTPALKKCVESMRQAI